jgi:hypothetical protein
MIGCEACERMNPPNRLKCIYCGKALAIAVKDAASIKPTWRKLELWERGYNLITRERLPQPDVAGAASFLLVEPDSVSAILDAGTPLPMARVESEKEATIVQDRLSQFGIACSVVSDADLAADKPPVRLSSVEFLEGRLALTDFNTGERNEIDAAEFRLFVTGMICVDRVDSIEKKRRGGKTRLIDETATASDEMLLDLYACDKIGYRVHLAGFDFSCLGEDKGLLAGENLRRLIVRLAEHLPNAKLVTDYPSVKHVLDHVWEMEARKHSKGLQRAGFGKVEFGSTASSNNINQFTKYSRLQWHL